MFFWSDRQIVSSAPLLSAKSREWNRELAVERFFPGKRTTESASTSCGKDALARVTKVHEYILLKGLWCSRILLKFYIYDVFYNVFLERNLFYKNIFKNLHLWCIYDVYVMYIWVTGKFMSANLYIIITNRDDQTWREEITANETC